MKAVIMVDFVVQNGRIEMPACNKTWPEKEVGETHHFASLSIGESSNHYGEEVKISGIMENVIINEQNMCSLFPTQCTEEELITEVHKNLGLEDLGLEHDLEILTLGQATIGCDANRCSFMVVSPGFEPWRRCDNVINIDQTSGKHVYNHKESVYNRSQG